MRIFVTDESWKLLKLFFVRQHGVKGVKVGGKKKGYMEYFDMD